jgi:membrane fusion protein, adhesin transport system
MLATWINRSDRSQGKSAFILPIELEDTRPVEVQRLILRFGSLLLLALTLWAAMTPIREMAIAPGLIIPKGEVRSVQHFEGGIVAEIYRQAGDVVRAGDQLIRLAPAQVGGDLGQLTVRLQDLKQTEEQLQKLLDRERQHLPIGPAELAGLSAVQQGVLLTRANERNDERKTLRSRVAQKKIEIESAKQQIVILEKMLKLRTDALSDRESLLQQGLATRRALLEDNAAVEQTRIQLMNANAQMKSSEEALIEAQSMLASSDASALRIWSEELAKVTSEAKETEESITKQKDRFDRLVVRAPVDGTVQFVTLKSVGEVVKAGDTILKIVPTGVPLMAEVQIKPDDIGNVKVGDTAELKVTAFDSAIYGKLMGRIESVSPSSFQRENGDYFYKATVTIMNSHLLGNAQITPGMIVSAEIITGAKSFLRYILKPIFKVVDPAFGER